MWNRVIVLKAYRRVSGGVLLVELRCASSRQLEWTFGDKSLIKDSIDHRHHILVESHSHGCIRFPSQARPRSLEKEKIRPNIFLLHIVPSLIPQMSYASKTREGLGRPLKVPRASRVAARVLTSPLVLFSSRSPPRELDIEEIADVMRGHKTPAFWQQAAHRGLHALPAPELCFSLIGHERTLDLAAETVSEAQHWVAALAGVAVAIKQEQLSAAKTRSVGSGNYAMSKSSITAERRVELSRHPPSEAKSGLRARIAKSSNHASPALGELQPEEMWSSLSWVDRFGGSLDVEPRVRRQQRLGTPANWTAGDAPDNGREEPVHQRAGTRNGEGGVRERAWTPETLRAWRKRLFPAVVQGDAGAVVALFEQGCPVDLVEAGTGDTVLMLACRLGDIGIAGECLRRGSKNDPHPAFGQTALQVCALVGGSNFEPA